MGNCIMQTIYLHQLQRANVDDIPIYTMAGIKTYARVVDVYDGDTITIVMKHNKKLCKFKVRMHGYDAPEMKPSLSNTNREREKEAALHAKNKLSTLILNKIVILECLQFDKYGRLLGNIYTMENLNINDYMIKNVLGCYVYNGGAKKIYS